MGDTASFLARVLPAPAPGRALGIHYVDMSPDAQQRRVEWTIQQATKQGKTPEQIKEAADKANERPGMPGRAFYSVAEAADWIQKWQGGTLSRGLANVDFYVSMALCGQETHGTDKRGRPRMTFMRQRGAMASSRALFADIDIAKDPDSFPTREDALAHVDALVAQGKLPTPTVVVNSGNGLHLHWALDRELGPAQWYVLGPRFSGYLKSLGVKHDVGITSDAVRVMRVPGTFNVKDLTNPKPTSLMRPIRSEDVPVAEMERLLGVTVGAQASTNASPLVGASPTNNPGSVPLAAPVALTLPPPFTGAVPFAPVPVVSEFSAGIDNAHIGQPVDFARVVASCPTLSDILARNGNGDSGALWRQALLAATFAPVAESRAWAHDFSRGDPRYDQAQTDSVFDARIAARVGSGGRIGWPTCKTFSLLSPQCAACPRMALNKTPFHGAEDDSDLPFPFFRRNGHIYFRAEPDEDGKVEEKLVLPYGIVDAYMETTNHGPALNVEVVHAHNPPKRLVLPISVAVSWRESAITALGAVGIAVMPAQMALARNFFVAFIQELQRRVADVAQRDAYGWTTTRSGLVGFAFGGRVYAADGTTELASQGDKVLAQTYRPFGEIGAWKQAADLIMGMGRVDLQLVLASAFAAPLVHFSGQTGVLFSVYSPDTGAQKSSAMKVAASVWGNPISGMSRLDDTNNHVGKKLGQLRHLPVYWDELTQRDHTEQFAKLAFALTLGTEKGRMGADTQLREAGSWATMLVVASNPGLRQSLLEGASANSAAGVSRMLEIEIAKVPLNTSAASAGMVIEQTHRNFGHAGALYAELLARESSTLTDRLLRISESLERATTAKPDERFWILAGATLLLGASLANQLDGGNLIKFDLTALAKYTVSAISKQRVERQRDVVDFNSDDFAVAVIQDYIAYCRQHNTCLETDIVNTGPGRPRAVEMRMPTPQALMQLRAPMIHIAHESAVIRMLRSDFRDWVVKERKLPFDIVRRSLEAHAGMADARGRWAAGTPWAGAMQTVHNLNMSPTATAVGARFNYGALAAPQGAPQAAGLPPSTPTI